MGDSFAERACSGIIGCRRAFVAHEKHQVSSLQLIPIRRYFVVLPHICALPAGVRRKRHIQAILESLPNEIRTIERSRGAAARTILIRRTEVLHSCRNHLLHLLRSRGWSRCRWLLLGHSCGQLNICLRAADVPRYARGILNGIPVVIYTARYRNPFVFLQISNSGSAKGRLRTKRNRGDNDCIANRRLRLVRSDPNILCIRRYVSDSSSAVPRFEPVRVRSVQDGNFPTV